MLDLDLLFYTDKCRFCCSVENGVYFEITNVIISRYSFVTNKQLIISPKLSNILCKVCNDQLSAFYNFKQEVIKRQDYLYGLLNQDEKIPEVIVNFKTEVTKVQQTAEDVEVNEEYIEEIYDSISVSNDQIIEKNDPFASDKKSAEIKCQQCYKVFVNSRKLKIHLMRVHGNERKCEYCNFTAKTKSDLLKHVKVNHIKEDSTDLRICYHCGKVLKGNNHLNFHIKTKHLKLTKYQCDLCSFKSYGKYEIRSHILIHHLPLELRKEFKCDQCDSVLTTAMSLKTHKMHKHSGLRPHSCNFCFKSYALKETLKSHIRNVHNGERKYKCSLCNKGYNSNNRLTDHINNTHGEKQEIPCDKCGKIFNSLRNLQTHSIYHADPTLKCNYCDKMFYIKKNLREHQDSVHLGVTYQCEICKRTFQSTSGLRRHTKNSHCKSN